MPDPAKPAPRPAPKGGRGARTAARPSPPAPKKRAGRKFEVDRIVVLRAVLVVIVLFFLYLVVRIGIVAFGGGGANQAKRVERVVNDALVAPKGGVPAKPSELPPQ